MRTAIVTLCLNHIWYLHITSISHTRLYTEMGTWLDFMRSFAQKTTRQSRNLLGAALLEVSISNMPHRLRYMTSDGTAQQWARFQKQTGCPESEWPSRIYPAESVANHLGTIPKEELCKMITMLDTCVALIPFRSVEFFILQRLLLLYLVVTKCPRSYFEMIDKTPVAELRTSVISEICDRLPMLNNSNATDVSHQIEQIALQALSGDPQQLYTVTQLFHDGLQSRISPRIPQRMPLVSPLVPTTIVESEDTTIDTLSRNDYIVSNKTESMRPPSIEVAPKTPTSTESIVVMTTPAPDTTTRDDDMNSTTRITAPFDTVVALDDHDTPTRANSSCTQHRQPVADAIPSTEENDMIQNHSTGNAEDNIPESPHLEGQKDSATSKLGKRRTSAKRKLCADCEAPIADPTKMYCAKHMRSSTQSSHRNASGRSHASRGKDTTIADTKKKAPTTTHTLKKDEHKHLLEYAYSRIVLKSPLPPPLGHCIPNTHTNTNISSDSPRVTPNNDTTSVLNRNTKTTPPSLDTTTGHTDNITTVYAPDECAPDNLPETCSAPKRVKRSKKIFDEHSSNTKTDNENHNLQSIRNEAFTYVSIHILPFHNHHTFQYTFYSLAALQLWFLSTTTLSLFVQCSNKPI